MRHQEKWFTFVSLVFDLAVLRYAGFADLEFGSCWSFDGHAKPENGFHKVISKNKL